MKRAFAAALGLVALVVAFAFAPAKAADVTVFWQCASTSASGVTTYGQCPANATYPLPTAPQNSSGAPLYVAGNIGGYDKVIPDATAVSVTTYTLNYALGSWRDVAVFRTTTQPSGLLDVIQINSKGGMTTAVSVWAFRRSHTNLSSTCTDNVLFALNSADLPYLVPGFPISITPAINNATTQSTGTNAFVPPISVNNADSTPSLNLAFCVVTGGTPTIGSTTDIEVNYGMIQD